MDVDFTVIGGAEPWSLYSRWPQKRPSRSPPCTPKFAFAPSEATIHPPPVTKSLHPGHAALALGASDSVDGYPISAVTLPPVCSAPLSDGTGSSRLASPCVELSAAARLPPVISSSPASVAVEDPLPCSRLVSVRVPVRLPCGEVYWNAIGPLCAAAKLLPPSSLVAVNTIEFVAAVASA